MSQIKNHREKDSLELIKHICLRPQMYVGSSKFRIVAAFVDGFMYALETDETREFSFWLGQKLNLPRNVAWFDNLEKNYPNDEIAFEKLPILFEEFRKDKENGWNFDAEFSKRN